MRNREGLSMIRMMTRVDTAAVAGYLHETEGEAGLALTHGAGANCEAPLLKVVAEAFAAAGVTVLRFDLAFRRKRRSGPPHPSAATADRDSIRAAVSALRERVSGPVYIGGHSYGGRQASMLAAEDAEIAAGLLLFSYPLHPPDKPDQLRTAHFPELHTPAVFVHGEADPFGSPEEMRAALELIPAAKRLIVIERSGHDLRRGKFDLAPVIAAALNQQGGALRWANGRGDRDSPQLRDLSR
jgi:uncharacterized protein